MKIEPMIGWLLLYREEGDDWCIARDELFGTKKEAEQFARDHRWQRWKAVRGRISVDQ